MLALLALAGSQVGQGLMAAQAANTAALNQRTAGLYQERDALDANLATNTAIAAANLQNTIRTGYKTGLLNVQRGQARRQALAAQNALGVQGLQALSQNGANAAASGTMGASVDAAVSDIEMKLSDARTMQMENENLTMINFDTQMHDLLQQGQDSLRAADKSKVTKTAEAKIIGMGEALLKTGMDMAGKYLSSQMSLGTGSAPSATPRPVNTSFSSITPVPTGT